MGEAARQCVYKVMLAHQRRILALGALSAVWAATSNPNAQDAAPGFLFGYSTDRLILPTLPSCPGTLTIPSLRSVTQSSTADPVPPYTFTMLVHEQLVDGADNHYERMYARSVNVGNMANGWSTSVPWINGTQMIGCMSSSNGVSGGCQDLMTVVSTADTAAAYAYPNSTCRVPSVMGTWVPSPSETLNVKIEHPAGDLASNGWPLSCTDIRVTPLNGTAPYSLLVAPAYHPPLEFQGNGAMNYTVRLSHGQAFMLGLFDSAGNSWAYGPLHAGHNDNVQCLGVNNGQSLPSAGGSIGIGALAGGMVGAFVVGALGAVLLLWGCVLRKGSRRSIRHQPLPSSMDLDVDVISPFSPAAHRTTSSTRDETSPNTGSATPAGRSQYDSYLNPKPYDPYADSPDLGSTHQLSYVSHRDSPGGATSNGNDELYDPYHGRDRDSAPSLSMSRGMGHGEGSNTWPRTDPRQQHQQQQQHHGASPAQSLNRSSAHLGEFGEVRGSHIQPHAGSTSALHNRHSAAGPSILDRDRDLTSSRSRSPSSPYQHQQGSGAHRHSFQPERYPEHSPPLSDRHQQRFRSGSDVRVAERRDSRGNASPERSSARNVYIVHSEAGPEHDVHIRLPPSERDSRIIEMPPEYRPSSWGSARTGPDGRGGEGNRGRDGDRKDFGQAGAGDMAASRTNTGTRPRSKSELERLQAEYLGLDLDCEDERR